MPQNFLCHALRNCAIFLLIFRLHPLCALSPPDGIQYRHYATNVPQSIHVLIVDPEVFSICAAKALDQCIGREDVRSLARRKKAIAAFNGGYFAIGKHDGAPAGILKICHKWYGLPTKPRGAIGWRDGGKRVIFDRLLTHIEGIDIIVDSQTGDTTSTVWQDMEYIVGGIPLLIKNGEKIQDFSVEQALPSFLHLRHARTAVGLLPNGHWVFVVVDKGNFERSFSRSRNELVSDEQSSRFSHGMTIQELSDFMEDLGCTDALNLDGGGSTTFVYQGQVINHPTGDGDDHDKGKQKLRPVSDAILIGAS